MPVSNRQGLTVNSRHPRYGSAFEQRRRARNWATFAGLLALVVLFYIITVLRIH